MEYELDALGMISGHRSDRFGIYYGKTKTDTVKKYRSAKMWGNNVNEAFTNVKQAIVNLLQSCKNKTIWLGDS